MSNPPLAAGVPALPDTDRSPTLFEAHRQFRERRPDESYDSLQELYAVVHERRLCGYLSEVYLPQLSFDESREVDNLYLKGGDIPLTLTHWAFTQLCEELGASSSAHLLRMLPAHLIAAVLNHFSERAGPEQRTMLWAKEPGAQSALMRSLTKRYSRRWDDDFVGFLLGGAQLLERGWHRPIPHGGERVPQGIWSCDRNTFVFLVHDKVVIDDGAGGLLRGFFVWNTEVKHMSMGFKSFLFHRDSGGFVIWRPADVFDVAWAHVGNLDRQLSNELGYVLERYLDSSAEKEQAVVTLARRKSLGKDVPSVLNRLRTNYQYGKSEAEEVVEECARRGKDVTNLWDLVVCATFLNQRIPNADQRVTRDERAGRMLDSLFR